MTDKEKAVEPIVDWEPTPGHLLIKPLKREEVASELYGKDSKNSLSLPDNMGKISDSVGVGRVIKMAYPSAETVKVANEAMPADLELALPMLHKWVHKGLEVGDYVAFMPYTDLLIEIDGAKYSLIEYSRIRGVRNGGGDAKD